MKKLFLILALVSLCLSSNARTPKEYFESENGVDLLLDDLEEIDGFFDAESDRSARDIYVDSIRAYVYNEVLPTKKPNSLEAADVLLRWLDFSYLLPKEELRAVAQRVKAIVLPIEGKSLRYTTALDQEMWSWNKAWGYDKMGIPCGADTAKILSELFEERLACYRHDTRPTDKKYLNEIREQTFLLCRTKYCEDYQHLIEMSGGYWYEEDAALKTEYHYFAALWRDLLKWDSISKEEYSYLCDSLRFYASIFDEEEILHCLGAASYHRSASYPDFVDIALAHQQIAGKVYGVTSQEYLDAADLSLEALRSASYDYSDRHEGARDTMHYIDRAQALCEEMLQSGTLTTDSAFYWWQFQAYQCQLSAKGPSKKLGKQIDQTVKKVQDLRQQSLSTTMKTLYYYFSLSLQVDYALMVKDYKRAEKVLAEYWKQLPPIPDDRWADEGKFLDAVIVTDICARKYCQVYMLKGDFDKALYYFNICVDLIEEWHYDAPQTDAEKESIAQKMDYYCHFPNVENNPYSLQLQKRFEEQLFKWSGFRPE